LVWTFQGDEQVSPGSCELDVEVGEVDLRGECGERAGDDAGGKGEQTDRSQFVLHGIPGGILVATRSTGRDSPTNRHIAIATSPDAFLILLRGMDLAIPPVFGQANPGFRSSQMV
jgi:hypothetical protein